MTLDDNTKAEARHLCQACQDRNVQVYLMTSDDNIKAEARRLCQAGQE